MAFVEFADLVGKLSLPVILTHEAGRPATFQNAIELAQDDLAAFVRNFRLDDERRFVFPQCFPPGQMLSGIRAFFVRAVRRGINCPPTCVTSSDSDSRGLAK